MKRYDLCDETCTVDCGHCKGEGPPKEIDLDDPTVFDVVTPRKTSSYLLTIRVGPAGDPNEIADWLKEHCPVPVDTTGVGEGIAFIRFRASSPGQAVFIGRETTTLPFSLSTGYGAHFTPVDVG